MATKPNVADMPHPMQPIGYASDGVIRFKPNKIIEYLFENGLLNLNEISAAGFSEEDRMQLAQLLGYSVSGYRSLSYVSEESAMAAYEIGHNLFTQAEKS